MSTKERKLDHIMITLTKDIECKESWFEYVHLVHVSAPEVDLKEVKTEIEVFGKKLSAPIIIAGMTGGHPSVAKINKKIAEVVQELGLGMGVGSQRAMIERPELSWTYEVRKEAPDILLIGNIGAPQLNVYDVEKIEWAIKKIEADALAIHLNPAQEAFQPEGDVDYRNIYEKVAELVEKLDVPIIIKETGAGIAYEVAQKFHDIGVKGFDVSGKGGTSWVRVEQYRAMEKGLKHLAMAAEWFSCWGIPTAASIIEVRAVSPKVVVIGSGGIRDGLQAVKALALGADLVAFALPALRLIQQGKEELKTFLEAMMYSIKAGTFLQGFTHVKQLKGSKIVIEGPLKEWVMQRGVYDSWFASRKSISL